MVSAAAPPYRLVLALVGATMFAGLFWLRMALWSSANNKNAGEEMDATKSEQLADAAAVYRDGARLGGRITLALGAITVFVGSAALVLARMG